MTQTPPRRRASHLMDPDAPRVATSAADLARLERVQRTVLSVLVTTTIVHLSAGLVIGAFFIDERYRGARIGLCLLGGLTAAIAIASGRAIHGAAPVSWWLVLALVPTAVGLVVVLR